MKKSGRGPNGRDVGRLKCEKLLVGLTPNLPRCRE